MSHIVVRPDTDQTSKKGEYSGVRYVPVQQPGWSSRQKEKAMKIRRSRTMPTVHAKITREQPIDDD